VVRRIEQIAAGGGRQKGTPNKLPKGERALVKLDAAEAQVRALVVEGLPLETLGKDRLTELDAWAHAMAKQFAPKKDEETGRPPSALYRPSNGL
jgi:hypothetical protein